MRRGAPELRRRAVRTRRYGLVRWIRRPVVSCMRKPTQSDGRIRKEAPIAEVC
jgi:hypothetical protein